MKGKILVMNYDALKEEYRSRPFQLWLATGGFGCSPSARGRRVFATNMYDGEQTSFYRQDFAGIRKKGSFGRSTETVSVRIYQSGIAEHQ